MDTYIISPEGKRYTFSKNNTVIEKSDIKFVTPSKWAEENLFYLEMFGSFVCGSQYRVQRGAFDSYLLIYTKGGKGTIQTSRGTENCGRDDFVLIDCNEPHQYYSEQYWEFLWFHFNGNASKEIVSILLQEYGNVIHMPVTTHIRYLVENIVRRKNVLSRNEELTVSSDIHTILSSLIFESGKMRTIIRKRDWMNEAIAYIESHYKEGISIEDIAGYLNISKSSFCHTFKKEMGFSPYEFIINKRMSMAKELLKGGTESIRIIAGECGFRSEANFIKTFREKNGCTPSSYRKARNTPSDFEDVFFSKKLYD